MIAQPALAFCTTCAAAPGDVIASFVAAAAVLWLARRSGPAASSRL